MALIARLSNAAGRLAAAGRQYGESPATVAARMTWFRLRWGVSLVEGLLTGDQDIAPEAVSGRRAAVQRLLRQFNPSDDSVIDDKTFAARCRTAYRPASTRRRPSA